MHKLPLDIIFLSLQKIVGIKLIFKEVNSIFSKQHAKIIIFN